MSRLHAGFHPAVGSHQEEVSDLVVESHLEGVLIQEGMFLQEEVSGLVEVFDPVAEFHLVVEFLQAVESAPVAEFRLEVEFDRERGSLLVVASALEEE